MKFKTLIFLLMSFYGAFCSKTAKALGMEIVNPPDSGRNIYVQNLTRQINVTPFVYQASNRFTFNGGGKSTEYSPNEAPSLGIRFQHKWLGFAFMYGPRDFQSDKRGSSRYVNFFMNIYSKKVGLDLHFMESRGYFIRNRLAREEIKSPEDYPLRPDLSTLGVGINGYYIFNHNRYSMRATFLQNEIQQKTAGSWLITASASYYALLADSSIVPEVYKASIPKNAQVRRGEFYTFGIMPGYAITWVFLKRCYLTGVFSVGPMIQNQHYLAGSTTASIEIDQIRLMARGMLRFGIGYNAPRFYTGISAVGDNYNIPLGSGNKLQYTIGSAQIFVGTRFQFPGRYKPFSDWMDKIPIGEKYR